MAVSLSNKEATVVGNKRFLRFDCTFDSSYPTGGESISASDLGMSVIDILIAAPNGGLVFEYDHTNSKLKAFFPTGGASSTSVAAPSVAVPSGATAVTSTAAQPGLTETSGIAAEVGATADLSSIVARCFAIGQG